jgi:hypothetical protein
MKNYYLCPKCNRILQRESTKKTIKSDCGELGGSVTLTRIDSADKLAEALRKVFLKNAFELDSFKPQELRLLKAAFEQGVKVTFNALK